MSYLFNAYSNRSPGAPWTTGAFTTSPGDVWWVNSVGGVNDDAYGRTPTAPFASLNYAIAAASAIQGDHIFLMPGHAETLFVANITLNKSNLTIEGLGNGGSRPTFRITAGPRCINVAADDVLISGLNVVGTINNLTTFFDVDNDDCTIDDCRMMTSAALEAYCFINLATGKDNLTVRNCTALQPTDPEGADGAAGTGFLYCEDSENILVENCRIDGYFETGIFHNLTAACAGLWIKDCYLRQVFAGGATIFELVAGATGGITGSLGITVGAADVADASIIGPIGDHFFIGADSAFGNDGGGGQGAVRGTVAS